MARVTALSAAVDSGNRGEDTERPKGPFCVCKTEAMGGEGTSQGGAAGEGSPELELCLPHDRLSLCRRQSLSTSPLSHQTPLASFLVKIVWGPPSSAACGLPLPYGALPPPLMSPGPRLFLSILQRILSSSREGSDVP